LPLFCRHSRQMRVLKGFAKVFTVPQKHFSQHQTNKEVKRSHLGSNTTNTSYSLSIPEKINSLLLKLLQNRVDYTVHGGSTNCPVCWTQHSYTWTITFELVKQTISSRWKRHQLGNLMGGFQWYFMSLQCWIASLAAKLEERPQQWMYMDRDSTSYNCMATPFLTPLILLALS